MNIETISTQAPSAIAIRAGVSGNQAGAPAATSAPDDGLRKIQRQESKTLHTNAPPRTSKTAGVSSEISSDSARSHFDRFVKSGESLSSAGLYHIEKNEEGRSVAVYDEYHRAAEADSADLAASSELSQAEQEDAPAVGGNEKGGEEKTTANTDEVEREIAKLKKERQQLERELKQTDENDRKYEDLKARIAQVDAEIRQKDNDAYKKQHAVFTNEPA